jgi:hypothetical protein
MNSVFTGHPSSPEQNVDNDGMDLYEANTHPFVIKIWLEETAEEAGRAVWRGHITHVPTGQRRYIQVLDDIVAFIASYLEQMGVQPVANRRQCRWFRWFKRPQE